MPKLSPAAAAVLEAVHATGAGPTDESRDNRAAVARAWEAEQRNPMIAAFEAALHRPHLVPIR